MSMEKCAAIVVLLALLLSMSAAVEVEYDGVTVDFEPDTPMLNTDADFLFEELDENEEYEFVRVTDSGTETISAFTTSDQGRRSITDVGLNPVGNDVKRYDGAGWAYELRDDSGDMVANLTLYWGFDLHHSDFMNDGTINREVWSIRESFVDAYTEENQQIEYNPSGGSQANRRNIFGFRKEVSHDEAVFMRYNPLDTAVLKLEPFGDSDSFTSTRTFHIYFNSSEGDIQVWDVESGALFDSIAGNGSTPFTVTVEDNEFGGTARMLNFMTVPKVSKNHYTVPHTFASNDDGVFDWEEVVLSSSAALGLEFNDSHGWESFFEDVVISESLEFRDTRNGTLNSLYMVTGDIDFLELVHPVDGLTYEERTPGNVTFEYNVPEDYQFGRVALEVKRDGASEWTTFQSNLGIEDLDGDCVIQTTVSNVFNDCFGHTLQLDDVNNIFRELPPGTHEFRVRYNATGATENEDLIGTVFYSDVREVQRISSFIDLAVYDPVDGVDIDGDILAVSYEVAASIGGTLSIDVNGSEEYTEVYNGEFGPVTNIVSFIVDDGTQNVTVAFESDAGETVSERREFTAGANNDVNVSLVGPADGFETYDTNITLQYEIDTTEDGNAVVYNDGDVVRNRSIDAGSTGVRNVTINGLVPKEYTWNVVFEGSSEVAALPSRYRILESVNVSNVYPKEEQIIDTAPVTFRGNVSTTLPGTMTLYINLEEVESVSIPEVGAFEVSHEVTESEGVLDTGLNVYRWEFVSDLDGSVTSAGSTRFYINSLDTGPTEKETCGGTDIVCKVTNIFDVSSYEIGDRMLIASSVIIVVATVIAWITGIGVTFPIVVIVGVVVATERGMFPAWVGTAIAVFVALTMVALWKKVF